jgi:hypothetical protein
MLSPVSHPRGPRHVEHPPPGVSIHR